MIASNKPPPIPIRKAGENTRLKALIYGNSGSGKTRMCASLEEDLRTSPALILDLEKGTNSVSGSNIDVVPINTLQELTAMFQWLVTDKYYNTVVLDSLSAAYEKIMLGILQEVEPSRKTTQKDALEQQDYGRGINKIKQIINSFLQLDKHVIFTCLAKEEPDVKEGLIRKPALSGQLADLIPQYVDLLGYLMVNKEGNRLLVTQQAQGYRGKFRLPLGKIAPKAIEEPTFTKILDIKEGKA